MSKKNLSFITQRHPCGSPRKQTDISAHFTPVNSAEPGNSALCLHFLGHSHHGANKPETPWCCQLVWLLIKASSRLVGQTLPPCAQWARLFPLVPRVWSPVRGNRLLPGGRGTLFNNFNDTHTIIFPHLWGCFSQSLMFAADVRFALSLCSVCCFPCSESRQINSIQWREVYQAGTTRPGLSPLLR